MIKNASDLFISTPHHTTPHHTTPHHTTPHHTTSHHTTPHHTTPHHTTPHHTTPHHTTPHHTTPPQHNTTQHNTTQHNTTQHNTTLSDTSKYHISGNNPPITTYTVTLLLHSHLHTYDLTTTYNKPFITHTITFDNDTHPNTQQSPDNTVTITWTQRFPLPHT